MDGYHPGGSLVFDRLSDGSVVMAKVQRHANGEEMTRFSFVFSPDIWAGLIAYVADKNKGLDVFNERVEKARQFHKGNYQRKQPV